MSLCIAAALTFPSRRGVEAAQSFGCETLRHFPAWLAVIRRTSRPLGKMLAYVLCTSDEETQSFWETKLRATSARIKSHN